MPLDSSKSPEKDNTITTVESLLEPLLEAALNVYFPERDKHGNPSISRFLLENGRLPFISDQIKPWNYRGWLIPYLQMAEAHPIVSPRYDYVLRTLDAGQLLDEPLPQIEFCGEFERDVQPGLKMLKKCLDEVEYKSGSWNGMREFCEWIAFAVGVTPEASSLDEKVQEFLYRNFNLEPLLMHPSDYLGQMLCETSHGKKNGFYPTPINICQLMVEMVSGDCKTAADRRGEAVMDPCVGTGRMLLVSSNYSMRLFGQDIDYLCCLITKINLALYAPWFYIPDSFFGDFKPNEIVALPEETKLLPAPKDEQIEPVSEHFQENKQHSLYDRLYAEKQKKSRKYTTEIDNLPLFKI